MSGFWFKPMHLDKDLVKLEFKKLGVIQEQNIVVTNDKICFLFKG